MDNAKNDNASDDKSTLPSAGDGSKEANKFVNWIECRYEVRLDNVIQKLEAAEFGTAVASDSFGTGKLLWNVELTKQNEKATSGRSTKNKVSDDDITINANFVPAKLNEIPGGVRTKFTVSAYTVDASARWISSEADHPELFDNVVSFTDEGDTGGWENVCTMSELKSYVSEEPTGTLMWGAIILVENSHLIAYDLATHAHSLRLSDRVLCGRPNFSRPLFIELRAREFSVLHGVKETSDNSGENISVADGNEPKKHALCDADSIDKTIVTDAVDVQQVQYNKMDVAEPIAALNPPSASYYESSYVWKSLLVQASPVFKAMFEEGSDTVESETGVVIVEDFPHEVVGAFVDYISRGPVAIEEAEHELLAKVVKMANKYRIKDLFNLGVARMLRSIQLKNVAEYYATAHVLDIVDVKTACIAAIKQKWTTEAGKDEFWSRDFGHFGMKVMAAAFADYVKLA